MNWLLVDEKLKSALKEDIYFEDITTESIFKENKKAKIDLIAKEDGIIAGLEVFKRVFLLIGDVHTNFYINEGEKVTKDQKIGEIIGDIKTLLTGERVALNFLQRMSGIATLTRQFTYELKNTKTKLLDTRKTTPNLRVFEKYAVRIGGGFNHRLGLSDGILIKDNHINAAGGIKCAVALIKNNAPFVRKIEVEVENLEQLKEAIDCKVDIIMLDNMSLTMLKKAVSIIDGKSITEASGNITIDKIKDVADCGVDYISTGAITHSFKVLDLSIKNLTFL
ncbi:carboxylating nicotinate-nucleotide diphosphorylase [Clostridium sporogenes]|uniref:Probable nicotinate-nucleotide pyrophosphorylase [carboxylating] n=1 Tax=Clostridium botulinum TaxID=1491 RepID=A0A6M0T1A0_CLOBO|nr:carboxylating nicotinate-nucleotide diphosphorylase [Clostridium sporogenes]NFA60730.1 carboxylating nicotinate-nucleotide diphosphorylase [Clostridium botulinum]NFI72539.1 carboxylating nicotinate-nucleotide diphosphorylase [Clostridium sporogenes]NFL73445.1 carboxylating nicotinate-nucleotide diphosphorylase [Clostridium sporogenes]NFM23563.1 carboxylating nicotinate-nucleotide diphosphorylase [Clostridium sporogenes]NFP62637.1 carboxylating nicotinate-nucleotide diphosphorylase [Clostrid